MAEKPKDQDCDPTKDATFQRVVEHFLKTPHKPHKPTAAPKTKRPGGNRP